MAFDTSSHARSVGGVNFGAKCYNDSCRPVLGKDLCVNFVRMTKTSCFHLSWRKLQRVEVGVVYAMCVHMYVLTALQTGRLYELLS